MRISKLVSRKVNNNHLINDLKTNSKKVVVNDIFYAIKGENFDGHEFILDAITRGARTIVLEKEFFDALQFLDINFIYVEDVRKTLAMHAKIFFNDISKDMTLIGVTGTNGKTTVTTLIYKYFQYLQKKATLIGTNGIYIMNKFYPNSNTTPDILELYKILIESKKNGVNTIIMEVSSHAVKMMRIYGLEFNIALITNLTQDHLDYHKTMEDYRYTKGLFLSSIKEENIVIINKDIPDFKFYHNMVKARVKTYGMKNSDYELIDYKLEVDGSNFYVKIRNEVFEIKSKLLGLFNIYNILSFIAIIDQLKLLNQKTFEYLSSKINILGRMEVIRTNNRYFVIDFAHTPDGVENVLKFLNQVKKGSLFVVIGCGGNRDETKRKVMGYIVSQNADFVIFTNDNPRHEDPNKIITDILEGVKTTNYAVIIDRKMAIEEAYKRSLNNDIIAILGKGNEQYQIIGDENIPFNDKSVVQELKL